MNEEQQKDADRGKTTAGGKEDSTTLPPFRTLFGGKTQRSAINHQSVLTRMIFVTVFFCLYILSNSLTSCASVELGSHISPITSHFKSSSISSSNISNPNLRSNPNPLASNARNVHVPRENHSNEGSERRLRSRQVSTSEWIFSSLVQLSDQSSTDRQQPPSQSSSRGKSDLTYRSMPLVSSSNTYTNYYRNPNIYAQTPRRVNGNDNKSQNKNYYNDIPSPNPVESIANHPGSNIPAAIDTPNVGLNRRRASSSLPTTNELRRKSYVTASSKMPEVLSEEEIGTTGVSRTAPATDPSLLATERPTSTQEMQISNDESSTMVDDIQLGSRTEIGSERRGKKRGRDMNDATMSFHFESDSPIVFPGTSPAVQEYGGTSRPYIKPGDVIEMGTFNPFQAKVLDGWAKLHELRRKSQTAEGRKSSVSSDRSADAKIVRLLTISGVPNCASKEGYCENIETYPRNFFDQVLHKTLSPDIFKGIFGETTDNNTIITDVELKLRHEFDETPLCSVREHTIYPKAAQNRKGKFMYIVNHDEYLQGIRVETCTRENDECMFTEGHLPGYSSTCKQKFIYKKLLAFTPEGKAMPDTFRLPSCCVCHVRSMFVSDRINHGADGGNADLQPTVSADDSSWNPSSTTLTYPHHDDALLASTSSSPSSTEPNVASSITFPTTSKNDLPTFQVPSPTSSTSSSPLPTYQQTGGQQQNSRTENQTASRRLH